MGLSRLARLEVSGYKSIEHLVFEPGGVTVLIGANGAGKSNLLSLFRLLNHLATGNLRRYVGWYGRASAHLRFGPKRTPAIDLSVQIETDTHLNTYRACLEYSEGDEFQFADEGVGAVRLPAAGHLPQIRSLGGAANRESLLEQAGASVATARVVYGSLRRWNHFHFHDTSRLAPLHQSCRAADGTYLRSEGANLAAVLLRFREEEPERYRRVVDIVRMAAPFFDDFVLEPDDSPEPSVLLQWRQRGADATFGSLALSDGTLRFIALATLLLQPRERLPDLVVIDEPELGLHPYAITLLAELVQAAAVGRQFVLATQSQVLVDCVEPHDVVVVSQEGEGSRFDPVSASRFEHWLEEFSVGELWARNVIGGRPVPWSGS